jgi:hypothetical protein
MKRYIPFTLMVGLTLLMSAELFSQTEQTGSNNSRIFNEGGYVRGITPARIIGLAELALGLSSLIIATRAKQRLKKDAAKIGLILGLAAVFSVVHFLIAAGAVFGSGSGKAGAIIAFMLGVIGVILALRTLGFANTGDPSV